MDSGSYLCQGGRAANVSFNGVKERKGGRRGGGASWSAL